MTPKGADLDATDLIEVSTIVGGSYVTKSISWEDKIKLIESFLIIRGDYDVIIYVSPEGVDIEDNGVRITDAEYRQKIDFVIKGLLQQYPPKKLIEIKGSTEERINSILSQIN